MATAKEKFISNKIGKIMKEGIRENTQKPVSSSNPRQPVSQKQAVAVAYSMAKKKPQLSQRDQYKNAMNKAQKNGGSNGVGVGI